LVNVPFQVQSFVDEGIKNFLAIKGSADAKYAILTTYNSKPLWTTSDFGATWSYRLADGVSDSMYSNTAIASSRDGKYMVAQTDTSTTIYKSTDFGASFATVTGPPATSWRAAAISDDGTQIAFGQNGGSMYAPLPEPCGTFNSASPARVASACHLSALLFRACDGCAWCSLPAPHHHHLPAPQPTSRRNLSAVTPLHNWLPRARLGRYTSSDSGASWATVSQFSGSIQWFWFHFTNSIFAAVSYGGTPYVMRAT